MKKMILTALVIASTAVGLNAQNTQAVTPAAATTAKPAMQGQPAGMPAHQMPSPEERAKHYTDHINQVVTLTPEQTKKVNEINTKFETKADDIRKSMPQPGAAPTTAGAPAQAPGADFRTKFKDLNDEREASLKKVFTPEQMTKWEASHAARPNPTMAPKPGATPAGAAPATAPTKN